jgi:hypothetical protein
MADEMGSKNLDTKSDELEETSYRIVTYRSKDLPQDLKPKIFSNFLTSLRYGNDYFKIIDKENYFTNYTKYINILLNNPNVVLKFAMLKDDTVLGWSMSEGRRLHYVWVSKDQQRSRIGISLIPIDIESFTHITNKAINFWLKNFPNARFEPFG